MCDFNAALFFNCIGQVCEQQGSKGKLATGWKI